MPMKKMSYKAIKENIIKDTIQKAAVQVLTHYGIQGFTMDKVAQVAGIAKPTLYAYFKDKDHLLRATFHSSVVEIAKELLPLLDSGLAIPEKLEKLALKIQCYFNENRDLFKIFVYDHQVVKAHAKKFMSEYQTLVKKLTGVIEEGMATGIFRALDAEKMAFIFVEANIGLLWQRLWTNEPGLPEDDARMLCEVYFNGIAAGGKRA